MEGALVKPPAYAKTWLEISLPPSEFAYCIIERLCARGELICWARLGSPDGAWIEFPSEAWEVPNPHPLSIQQPGELRIEPVVPPLEPRDDRILGTVERYKLDEKRVRRRNPQTGRTEYVIEEVKIHERWYNPVFAPAPSREERSPDQLLYKPSPTGASGKDSMTRKIAGRGDRSAEQSARA